MIVKLSSITEKQLNVSDLQDTKGNTIINSFKQFVYVISEAQNKLYENAAFIPEQLYNSFYEVYDAASGEFWVINDRLDKAINGEKCDDILISQDDHEIAKAIETMNQKLNYDLRQYLESLAVVE